VRDPGYADAEPAARAYVPIDAALARDLDAIARATGSADSAANRVPLAFAGAVVLGPGAGRFDDIESVELEVRPDGGLRAVACGVDHAGAFRDRLCSPTSVHLADVLAATDALATAV
jgi:hypothetical protein